MVKLTRYVPMVGWLRTYRPAWLLDDFMAAVVVTIMLIPQSLAYAMLANLPPQVGLYASLLPLLVYALLGSSRYLAVGPVAVSSMMSAAFAGQVAAGDPVLFYTVSMTLALLGGLMMIGLGFARFGSMTQFISHPVVIGFTSGSALLIAATQLGQFFGVNLKTGALHTVLMGLWSQLNQTHGLTLLMGVLSLVVLGVNRWKLKPWLAFIGLPAVWVRILPRLVPIAWMGLCTIWAAVNQAQTIGVKVVGQIPAGLPSWVWPVWDPTVWQSLVVPAFVIAMIGFVESVSVGQTLAAKQRQKIDSNQELIAIGSANVASAFTGGYVVTGGFARSAVNYDAGARTQLASVLTAAGIALVSVFLTPYLYYLPKVVLAATIVIAVIGLVDVTHMLSIWQTSRPDGLAMLMSFIGVLTIGVEEGIVLGILVSFGLLLWQISRPHIAIVGLLPGTEHFRNIERFKVWQSDLILMVRIDESLYFPNNHAWQEQILAWVVERPSVRSVVLDCSAINVVDTSSIHALEQLAHDLANMQVQLVFSQIKGPVMDRFNNSPLQSWLRDRVFLTNYQALVSLDPAGLQTVERTVT